MAKLSALNDYSATSVTFTVDTITVSRSIGNTFVSPTLTWIPVSQLGPLTNDGVQITYNVSAVANTTVTFDSIDNASNVLTVENPSTGVYIIEGIKNILDYNASLATIHPPIGYTGNVAYTAAYINTNGTSGSFNVSFVGVPA